MYMRHIYSVAMRAIEMPRTQEVISTSTSRTQLAIQTSQTYTTCTGDTCMVLPREPLKYHELNKSSKHQRHELD